MTLPKLSIAAKLYVIFALMAATTLALSTAAVRGARHHATLTDKFESANGGSLNVERVSGLVFAATAEMHAVTLAPDLEAASKSIEALETISDKIGVVTADWQGSVTNNDAVAYSQFAVRLSGFQDFASELVRIANESGPQAALRYANQANAVDVHSALTKDLETLGRHYNQDAQRIYNQIDQGIDATATWLSLHAGFAVMLAVAGVLTIARGVARPISAITRVTEAVAAGEAQVAVPYAERRDEIGALARSIAVFQRAMRHNEELNRTVVEGAETRSRRQEQMSGEISRFSAEVEATLAELGRISDQMLAASTHLGGAADDATAKTARASAASAEASSNVRDIASAADELSASVNEIDRQVAQSNAIATKAVNEAGRTNLAVKELDEAAARIGDVIKLITDIAEQTNLLALNATIEAARAGEAGRGFAVVASEVKALAGQTSHATEEIAAQIAGMQRATTRSIDAITAIETIIREIGEISAAIAAAVTEQGAATQEIARSVEIAARRTVDTADEVNLVGSATEDTRASAGAVKTVAEDLGSVAGRIRSQVDQFFERISA